MNNIVNEYRVQLTLKNKENILLSIYKSLYPDALYPPPECSIDLALNSEELTLVIKCKRISLLRALFNSYFSILSMILHVYEGLNDESAKNTSRSPEDTL